MEKLKLALMAALKVAIKAVLNRAVIAAMIAAMLTAAGVTLNPELQQGLNSLLKVEAPVSEPAAPVAQ